MTDVTTIAAGVGHNRPPKRRVHRFKHPACAECAQPFVGPREAQFCAPKCKDTFWNRMGRRGKVAMPLALAWREGKGRRGDEASAFAFRQLCAMLDDWNAEDRKAGRSAAKVARRKMDTGWTAADQNARERSARKGVTA